MKTEPNSQATTVSEIEQLIRLKETSLSRLDREAQDYSNGPKPALVAFGKSVATQLFINDLKDLLTFLKDE